MKVLVTGANGMLGRAVVAEFVRRAHGVRALVRPAARVESLGWNRAAVEVFRADLRVARDLAAAFDDIDILVHLAAAVTGPEDLQFASTVVGTERLLDAMTRSRTKALVLASSLSVYDWSEIEGELTEESPLESDVYGRDGYAVSKIWQERVVRRMGEAHGWRLTVLRPGFIWGRDGTLIAGAGQGVGAAHVIFGPLAHPPLTHVANCADAFVTVAENSDRAAGQTFNVVDGHDVSNWRFVGTYLRHTASRRFRLPVPYGPALSAVRAIEWTSKTIFHGKGKLPSLFVPCRFEARFKPLRCDSRKLRSMLGWSPPHSLEECLRQTYASHSAGVRPADPHVRAPADANELSNA